MCSQEPLLNKRQIQAECESLSLMDMNNILSALDIVVVYMSTITLSAKHHTLTINKYMTETLLMKQQLPLANVSVSVAKSSSKIKIFLMYSCGFCFFMGVKILNFCCIKIYYFDNSRGSIGSNRY